MGASASSSSALRLNFDGSSGVERSKERSSLHRRKEKKRKEKKKKKKGPSPHKDKGERGKGREITGPHLSKEVSSWSRKSSMSSPRSWAPRAESWVSRWRKSCWSADVSGDAPSKSSSSSSSSQPGRGGELLEEKGVGEEGEGGGEHVRVEELALWRLSRKSSTPHHVSSAALSFCSTCLREHRRP